MNIDNGTYRAKAKEWAVGTSSKGTEQIAVKFDLPDIGATITWYGFFSEAACDRTVEALKTMGWDAVDFNALYGPEAHLDANEVNLVVENEEYQGKWSPKVKWVNAIGGPIIKNAMSEEQKRSFAARMNAKLRASGAASKPAAKPSPKPKAVHPAHAEPPPPSDADFVPDF